MFTMPIFFFEYSSDPVQVSLRAQAQKILTALGKNYGPGHLELINTPDRGPIMVDIGSRLCGAGLPELVEFASDQGQLSKTVQAYADTKGFIKTAGNYSYTQKKYVRVVFLRAQNGGKKFSYDGIKSWIDMPAVVGNGLTGYPENLFAYKPGQKMQKTYNTGTTAGVVKLMSDSQYEIDRAYQAIRDWEKQRGF